VFVVDLHPTQLLARDGIRTLDEVDLEPDEVPDIVGVPRNWYHGQQVEKRLSSLAIVDEALLHLTTFVNHLLEVVDSTIIDKLAL